MKAGYLADGRRAHVCDENLTLPPLSSALDPDPDIESARWPRLRYRDSSCPQWETGEAVLLTAAPRTSRCRRDSDMSFIFRASCHCVGLRNRGCPWCRSCDRLRLPNEPDRSNAAVGCLKADDALFFCFAGVLRDWQHFAWRKRHFALPEKGFKSGLAAHIHQWRNGLNVHQPKIDRGRGAREGQLACRNFVLSRLNMFGCICSA